MSKRFRNCDRDQVCIGGMKLIPLTALKARNILKINVVTSTPNIPLLCYCSMFASAKMKHLLTFSIRCWDYFMRSLFAMIFMEEAYLSFHSGFHSLTHITLSFILH